MGPEIILFIAAVITKMIFTHREDMAYAQQGKDSPRYRMKMAQYRAAQARGDANAQPPVRLGAKGYWKNLWHDLFEDLDGHRERVKKERADGTRPTRSERAKESWAWTKRTLNRRRDGRPVDDMLDVIADPKPAGAPPAQAEQMKTAGEVNASIARDRTSQPTPTGSAAKPATRATSAASPAKPATPPAPAAQARPNPPRPVSDSDNGASAKFYEPIQQFVDGVRATAEFPCGRCGITINGNGSKEAQVDGETRRVCLVCAGAVDAKTESDSRGNASTTDATDTRPVAPVIKLFPSTKEINMATSEVTGLRTAMAYAEGAAEAHASFSTGGAEGYKAAVGRLGFGDGVTSAVAEAQAASATATAKWTAVREAMEPFARGTEFYRSNPDAPDKQALVNE